MISSNIEGYHIENNMGIIRFTGLVYFYGVKNNEKLEF